MDKWLACVIDTNIWISAFINPRGRPARLIQFAFDGRILLGLSEPLIAEILQVLRRDRIRRRIARQDLEIQEFMDRVRRRSIIVQVGGGLRMCRDPKDDLVLETAIVGEAQYVVSRDEDLTRDLGLVEALQGFGIEVLTMAHLLEILEAETA